MSTTVKTATLSVPPPRPPLDPARAIATSLPPQRRPIDRLSTGSGQAQRQLIAPVALVSTTAIDGNAYDGTITELYQQLLGRDPDGAGLEHFREAANALVVRGASDETVRAAISDEIQQSDEFIDRVISAQYEQLLGREPDGAGLQGFRDVVRGAQTPEAGGAAVAAAITGSEEYQRGHLDQMINGVYRELLGRDADGAGLQQFTAVAQQQLDAGATLAQARAVIQAQVASSAEYLASHPPPVSAPAPVNPAPPSGIGSVPYINQYAPAGAGSGYGNASANCGPTSMAIIARAVGYGNGLSDAALIMRLGSIGGTTSDGTGVNGIVAMAQAMGQPAVMRGPGPNTGWIADQLRAGKVVVANGDYYAMPPHQNEAKTSGHYLVVTGVDGSGNFTVRDPADAGAHTVTPSQLAYFIGQNPNGGFQFAIG